MRIEPLNGTARNGKPYTIRHAEPSDAAEVLQLIRKVWGETRYLLKEPEEAADFTEEGEAAFLQTYLEDPRSLMLLAVMDGVPVGTCSFEPALRSKRTDHRSSRGIALCLAYTGLGLGEKLMRTAMGKAKECGFESIELDVVSTNEPAIRLYEKLGFEIYGKRPYSMKYKDGTYATDYQMIVRL